MTIYRYGREILTINNDHLYILGRNSTFIIDISDPTEPTLVGETRELKGHNRDHAEIIDGYLYLTGTISLAGRIYHLGVYDLSDPLEPELIYFTNDFEVRRNKSALYSFFSDIYLFQSANYYEEMVVCMSLESSGHLCQFTKNWFA